MKKEFEVIPPEKTMIQIAKLPPGSVFILDGKYYMIINAVNVDVLESCVGAVNLYTGDIDSIVHKTSVIKVHNTKFIVTA
jgi:hypothetical protein